MALLDWIIVLSYFAVSTAIALYFRKRASENSEEFFLSGRKLPWWVAGTTMVATTFAADTPLAVTELVASGGIAGNWLWWNMVAGTVLTVFFFARLWRRAGVLTDVEFIEIRYSGKPAAFLRGFRALYLGLFLNVIIMGWVNVALAEILKIIFGIPEGSVIFYIAGAMLIVGIYSATSGLWGIAYTDMFQFVTAMAGSIILAVVVLNTDAVGGIQGIKSALPAETFNFFPAVSSGMGEAASSAVITLSVSALAAHLLVQWWASWYPGSEPGGGGYIAQRMMSAKSEGHSQLATLWFAVAHYALRPWPWIIVALASMVLYPDLAADEKKAGFVMAMKDYLPVGLLGMLVAAFLAAYMSTISTHLNWGASYLVNDLYVRFFRKDAENREVVLASRVATLLMVLFSTVMVLFINRISGAWTFIIECGAGLGLVLILRWYWWRVNAWSEISAMIVPFAVYGLNHYMLHITFPHSLYLLVSITTVAWIIITFLTPPVNSGHLQSFYDRVQPSGPGWKGFTGSGSSEKHRGSMGHLALNWLLGIILVYSSLLGIGKIVLEEYLPGGILLTVAAVAFMLTFYRLIVALGDENDQQQE